MIKDVWFRGAATCMGPRERYSPGPSLTLHGPGHLSFSFVVLSQYTRITCRQTIAKLCNAIAMFG